MEEAGADEVTPRVVRDAPEFLSKPRRRRCIDRFARARGSSLAYTSPSKRPAIGNMKKKIFLRVLKSAYVPRRVNSIAAPYGDTYRRLPFCYVVFAAPSLLPFKLLLRLIY